MKYLPRILTTSAASLLLGCWPYNPDELDPGEPPSAEQPSHVQSPATFAADLATVDVTGETDTVTITARNDAGTPIAEVALVAGGFEAGDVWLWSDYADGHLTAAIMAGDPAKDVWLWPTTLPKGDLVHRANLIADMIGAGQGGDADGCGVEITGLVGVCVDGGPDCFDRMTEVSCECLPDAAEGCQP